jgi:hypothetical protein
MRLSATDVQRLLNERRLARRGLLGLGAALAVGLGACSTAGAKQTTLAATSSMPATTAADWAAVGGVFGRQGTFKDGLYTVTFPRGDLRVTVGQVTLKPALATTTSITFFGTPRKASVMGDLILTEAERQAVIAKLITGGVEISAVHAHLPTHTPTVWWHHIEAEGEAVKVATAIKTALAVGTTPMGAPGAPTDTDLGDLDPTALDKAMGRSGTTSGGVRKYAVVRHQTITMGSMTVPRPLAQTAVAIQPVGAGRAAVNGDIVMTDQEVQPVLKALRGGGLDVIELHNHMLSESPRILYVHFWAVDDAIKLASSLRAAIGKTKAA